MCGILGVVGRPIAAARLRRMADCMRHRGPDAAGYVHWPTGAFAHRRLSILDTSAGANQPFTDPHQQAVLVFNGEIYNYQDLRRELGGHGHIFRTTSDTEVLLLGYLQWGEAVVERLNGMFAFAIWDYRARRLLLARDRLGKKPLYVAALPDGGLLFASELKPLLASGLVDATLDAEALVDYLQLNYILCPKTPLREIRQLPAAHVATWRAGHWQTRRYWDLADSFLAPRRRERDEDLLHELDNLLEDATRRRLFSDVPLGGFLSGGLDSSTIVALMRRLGTRDLHTFSVEFPAADFNEGAYSRLAAEFLGSQHHPRLVEDSLVDVLPQFARRMDTPLGDDSAISTYLLSRWARENVTVALSGDGADELFAGYITYQADWLHRWLRPIRWPVAFGLRCVTPWLGERGAKLSRRFRAEQLRRGLGRPALEAHFTWRQVADPADLLGRLAPDLLKAAAGYSPVHVFRDYYDRVRGADWLDRLLYVDCNTWLRDDILVKVDRASMAASLECRSPFLDYRVAEFAARLPRRLKLRGLRKKVALRRLASRFLPPAIVHRKKAGFNSPTADWLTGPLAGMAADLFAGDTLPALGIQNKNTVRALCESLQQGYRRHQYSLWGLFALALWQQHVRKPLANERIESDASAPVIPSRRSA
jgi:asparagine synthase (glutamine-hydrolysing)